MIISSKSSLRSSVTASDDATLCPTPPSETFHHQPFVQPQPAPAKIHVAAEKVKAQRKRVSRRSCCCCIPINIGVGLVAAIELIAGVFFAVVGGVIASANGTRLLAVALVAIHTLIFSVLALISLVGLVSSLRNSVKLARVYYALALLHLPFSVLSGAAFLYMIDHAVICTRSLAGLPDCGDMPSVWLVILLVVWITQIGKSPDVALSHCLQADSSNRWILREQSISRRPCRTQLLAADAR
ncbi:hypothetical protein HGRIS_014603 [Hohenbuehelia grisea]|uniref:Uncharacterized protein n=1 Tax=Hohenbuehelia grisea TaxID=104357 RepID=A0ABR3JUV4_9AGAR